MGLEQQLKILGFQEMPERETDEENIFAQQNYARPLKNFDVQTLGLDYILNSQPRVTSTHCAYVCEGRYMIRHRASSFAKSDNLKDVESLMETHIEVLQWYNQHVNGKKK